MDKPAVALLNVTYDCNNRCRWCYASPMGFCKDKMKLEDAKAYLTLVKSLGIEDIGFLGGEPTMHSELLDMIRFASSIGLRACLYTNARKLSDPSYVSALKEAGVYVVQADIHSADPDEHDHATRTKGSHAEAVRGIENCHAQGLRFRILGVLCTGDVDNYKRLIDRFASMKSHFVFFRQIPLITQIKEQKILSSEKTADIIEKLYAHAKERGVGVSFYLSSPLCSLRRPVAEMLLRENVLENYCHVLDGRCLSIDVDGKVLPCVHWPGFHVLNLKKSSAVMQKDEFLRAWNSEKISGTRKTLKRYPCRECAGCSFYGAHCRGGCPLVKFELGPYWKEYHRGGE